MEMRSAKQHPSCGRIREIPFASKRSPDHVRDAPRTSPHVTRTNAEHEEPTLSGLAITRDIVSDLARIIVVSTVNLDVDAHAGPHEIRFVAREPERPPHIDHRHLDAVSKNRGEQLILTPTSRTCAP